MIIPIAQLLTAVAGANAAFNSMSGTATGCTSCMASTVPRPKLVPIPIPAGLLVGAVGGIGAKKPLRAVGIGLGVGVLAWLYNQYAVGLYISRAVQAGEILR